jgi:hypothetical protein
VGPETPGSKSSMFRFHLESPIPFNTSLKVKVTCPKWESGDRCTIPCGGRECRRTQRSLDSGQALLCLSNDSGRLLARPGTTGWNAKRAVDWGQL